MNREQQEVLTLLKEIDAICRKNQITYFLSPRLTWSAVTGNPLPSSSRMSAVFMKLSDMERFRKAAEETPAAGRVLESMKNNKRFPGLFLRYENRDTLCFRLYEGRNFQYPGIGVDIIPLRSENVSKDVRKWDRRLETGWLQICDCARYEMDTYRFFCGCGVRLLSLAGRARVGQRIYDRLCRTQDTADAKEYFVCRSRTSYLTFPASVFRGTKEAVLEGRSFLIPADDEGYLSAVYGAKYASKNLADIDSVFDVMESARIGFEEYFQEVGSLKKLIKARRRQFLMENYVNHKNEYFNECWEYAKFCAERNDLGVAYLKKKEYIRNLCENRDLLRLDREFRLFRKMMNQSLERNEIFEPDEELLELYLNYLEMNGNKKAFNRIEQCRRKCN